METNTSKLSFSEIVTQAVGLPYHDRVELMGMLVDSLRNQPHETPAGVPPRDREYWEGIAKKYRGCMKGTWGDVDAVEYQRSLREEREIG